MAANDIPVLSTSNTFGQLLVSTNALIRQANLLNSGTYVKEAGDLRVLDGSISLEKTSGTTLTVASDATFGGTISSKTIINSGDLTVQGQNALFSNTTGTVTVRNNLVSSNVFANNITSNVQVTAQNVSVAGYLLATGSNLGSAPTMSSFGEKATINVANKMFVSNTGNVDIQGTILLSKTAGTALNVRSNAIFAGEVTLRSFLPIANISSSGNVAILQIQSTTGTTDNNIWHLRTVDSSGKLRLQAQTDALTGGGSILDINRNAQQITGIDLIVASTNDAFRITQTGTGRAFVIEDESPEGTPFVIDAGGNVGVGTTATTFAKMALRRDSSRPDAEYGLYSTFRTSSTSGSNNKFALQADVGTSAGYTGSHFLTAISGIAGHETSGTIAQLRGISTYLQSIGSGTVTNAYQFLTQEAGLGTGGSNTITNLFGYYASEMSSGTNNYAFYSNLSAAANKWGFYSSGTANSFFSGSLGLGTGLELNSYKLNVLGDSKITGNVLLVNTTAGDALRINQTGTGNAFVVQDETNPDSTPFVIDAGGNVGIGTTFTTSNRVTAAHTGSLTTTQQSAIVGDMYATASSGTSDKIGVNGFSRSSTGYAGTGPIVGVSGGGSHEIAGTIGQVRAFSSVVRSIGSGTVTNAIQYHAQDGQIGTGGANTITNLYGYYVSDLSVGTNDYGFYGDVSAGANKWNTYNAGTANNYFNGSVGVGITGPTSKLHVVGDANVTTSLTVSGMNVTQTIVNAYGQANLAYTQANTATTTAQSAYGQANLAYTQANTGVNTAIAAYGQANLAYATANAAYGQANLAYTQANTGTTTAQSAYGQANLAYAAANAAPAAAYAQANLAYARANTAANTTRVSLNRGSIQNSVALNFNNTANIIVTVGPGATGDANVSFDLPSTLASLSVTSLSATSLTVTNPIVAPSESDSASYRLRVSQTTRGDGTFGVNQGGANGNAEIKFVSSPGVWQLTSNNLTGTYYTILSSQNVSDSVSTTSSANVASLTAVKSAYDQATNAYNTANSSAATVRLTAGATTLANKQLNFVNTATITVSVVDSGTGNANISFTSTVAGGVTSVGTGIGLTGGPITGSGTISANIASTTVQGVTKLVNATNSTDAANAATAASVKAAYDQATLAYVAANTSANTIAVYANNSLILSNAPINFNNSSSVRVVAQANGTSFTNVSFSVIGGAGSGLDADTLDGLNSTSFIRSDANTSGNIGLSGFSPYIRLESNDFDLTTGQEIASILFATTDGSVGAAGDKGKISAEAEGVSAGGILNFYTSTDGGTPTLGASLRGNNDLRLFSSAGINSHSIRSQAVTASGTLILPQGDITLKVGVAANVTELGVAYGQANLAYTQANTATTTAQSAYNQANLAYTQANTATTTAQSAYGQANLAYTQANTGTTTAQSAYNQANLAYTRANTGTNVAQSAYGQANLAYAAANTSGNTVRVSANGGSVLSNKQLNFVNTSTVIVSVTDSGGGSADVAFSVGGSVQISTGIGLSSTPNPILGVGTITANIATTSVQGVTKLIDSVASTDAANAATGAAVKTAFDQGSAARNQANLAYSQANTALNKTQVSVNGGSVQSNVGVNFNNTSTVQVTVGAGTAGNANVSFSVIPNFSSLTVTGDSTITGNTVIQNTTAGDALRINQTGSGNVFVAEDIANPDATPFVIDGSGTVIIGSGTSQSGAGVTAPATPTLQLHSTSTAAGKSRIGATYWGQATTQNPALELMKSGVGSTGVGDHVIVVDDESIGTIRWAASNGNVFVIAASVEGEIDGTPVDSPAAMPARLVFNTNSGGTSVSEKMRITSGGNVGIGNTAPNHTLSITGTAFVSSSLEAATLFAGNSSANTLISTSSLLLRNNGAGVLNATASLSAFNNGINVLELGGSVGNIIDFKVPAADDFDYRIIGDNSTGLTIYAGSSTASPNVLNIVSGNVNIDSGTFFVDSVANEVGIGTTTPTSTLQVVGTTTLANVITTGTIVDTPIVTITGNATYSDNGAGKVIVVNSTSPVTVTFDSSSAGASFSGFSVTIIRKNTGTVTIGNTAAIAKLNTANYTTSNLYSRYSSATVLYTATNEFILFGDIQ